MYYSPSIVELVVCASQESVLLLFVLVAGVNALGTIAGILLIDRAGRRTLFPYPATCLGCLQADCGFCAASNDELRPGSCLTNNVHSASYCSDNMCSWFSHGCPSEYGWLSLVESPFY
ncbi:unnamed protein product [Sphagnum troendelagicum]